MKLSRKAFLGGSTAYGLNTPESDLDYRGVFINTDPSKILGLERMDHVQKQETDDIVYYEIRKFFELLRNGNTGALEILFSDDLLETSDIFEEIQKNKLKFVDTDKMFRCLLGYMGERYGQLTSSIDTSIDNIINPKTQQLPPPW
jgi:predicted nucleotidyltransferase